MKVILLVAGLLTSFTSGTYRIMVSSLLIFISQSTYNVYIRKRKSLSTLSNHLLEDQQRNMKDSTINTIAPLRSIGSVSSSRQLRLLYCSLGPSDSKVDLVSREGKSEDMERDEKPLRIHFPQPQTFHQQVSQFLSL